MGLDYLEEKDSAIAPEFFSDAEAVEFKEEETSWRDVEEFVGDGGELGAVPAAEETEEQETQREAAEREHLRRQRLYSDLDGQLGAVAESGDVFAVTATMSKSTRAFNAVVSTFINLRNSSSGVMNYASENKGTRKAYQPNKSDFFCDFELTAKKALAGRKDLHGIFQRHIVELEGTEWTAVPMLVRGQITEQVGKAFESARLHPVGRYFHG